MMNPNFSKAMLAAGLWAGLHACRSDIKGPQPAITSVTPGAACNRQITTPLAIDGSDLSPLPIRSLGDDPVLVLPQIHVTQITQLDGESVSASPVRIADDPDAPSESHVRWHDQSSMSFDITAQAEFADGLYDVAVTNANGASATLPGALLLVPPPTLAQVAPEIVYGEVANTLTLTGDFFIQIADKTPTVTLGDNLTLSHVTLSQCRTLPGSLGAQACKSLEVTVPQDALSAGDEAYRNFAVTVHNPQSVACRSIEPLVLTVVHKPRLDALEASLLCMAQFENELLASGFGFLVVQGTTPDVAIGDARLPTAAVAGSCSDVVGPTVAVRTCTELTLSTPLDAAAPGVHAAAVENPAPVFWRSEEDVTTLVVAPPSITAIAPAAICLSGGDVNLEIVGDGFLDIEGQLPTLTLEGEGDPSVLTPAATSLAGCQTLLGSTLSAKSCTSFIVTLPQDTAGVDYQSFTSYVTNPSPAPCQSGGEEVTNYPPPHLTSPSQTSPAILCQGGGIIDLEGSNLRVGATVRIGGVAASNTEAIDCDAQGACTKVRALFGFLPASLIAASPLDIVIENADSCAAPQTAAVNVTAGPLLLYADPPIVYDRFANTLTVYATNFSSQDLVHVELVRQDANDPPLVLCDDTDGPTPCPALSQAGGGTFNVGIPADVLAMMPNAPSEAVFDLRAQTATDTCDARLVGATRVVSVPQSASFAVSPASGKVGERNAVTITMTAPSPGLFVATPRVYLTSATSGSPLEAVAFVDGDTLSAVIPSTVAITGAYQNFDLTLVNPDGALFIAQNAYRLSSFSPPRITSVSPGQLSSNGTVNVVGENFQDTATAHLVSCQDATGAAVSGTTPTVQWNSDTSLTLQVAAPAAVAPVACLVQITNPQDAAFDTYAALVFANSSGNIPAPRLASQTLNTARRALGATVAGATDSARFLFVAGGDTGLADSALASVEYAPLRLTGEPGGAFVQARYGLNLPRTHVSLINVGRALYAVGGADATGVAQSSVERAVVLDPSEVLSLGLLDFAFGSEAAPGLPPGSWIYQVAMVFASDDPINPCGESLPSEPFVITIPDVTDGLRLTLMWDEPDTQTAGTPLYERKIAGYRVYRSPSANSALSSVAFLQDVDGKSTTSYTDLEPVVTATIASCPEAAPTQRPLALGETSKWVVVPGLELVSPRKGAGVRAVKDATPSSDKFFIYAFSGLDDSDSGLHGYEVATLHHDPSENPSVWETGASFASIPAALQDGTGGCSGPTARWQAGLFLIDKASSSKDGVTFAITDEQQFLCLGPGKKPGGGDAGIFQSWLIDAATGLLVDASYRLSCTPSAATSGYGNISINKQLFTFGGASAPEAINATEWSVVSGSSNQISFSTYNNNGGAKIAPPGRWLHSTVLDRAYIYLLGGDTASGVSNTVEFGIW